MNILPKKRWHVRTKENIARVRKDEAEAAEKQRQEQLRIENADREARLSLLKLKSKQKLLDLGVESDKNLECNNDEPTQKVEHINLFDDLDHAVSTTNKEHDKDVKDKKEEYEKKIGYLTYLGQDTNEALKKKNWYEVAPESSRYSRSKEIKDTYEKLVLKDNDGKPKEKELDVKDGEIGWKAKQQHDPINLFKKYLSKPIKVPEKKNNCGKIKIESSSSKHKKQHNEKEDKLKKLEKLREARLKREQQEKSRTEQYLKDLHGVPDTKKTEEIERLKPKYNSQFNPELARQNYR